MTVIMDLPDYAVSPNPDLWNVTVNGEAFVWSDTGRTMALSVQVESVCGPVLQKRGGLPSLTAVLFLIEAMTTPMNLLSASARVEELFRPVHEMMRDDSKPRIFNWLVACGQLSADLRKGPARQGALLSDLMDNAPQSLFDIEGLQAIDAMHWLRLSLFDRDVTYLRPQAVSQLKSALAIRTLLHFANSRLNDASVRLRMQTGLDELPSNETETKLPPARPYSHLLNKLRDDEELGQFIQMAANAASTVALPRRPSDPDELQIGGVSDITNRGQPERLLMTELAADPDLLMARIAHGQALYLRRESPPQHRALRRRVLIENGVRMWGITRLRATAFALAVAACEERCHGPQLDVITVAGEQFWPEDLSTRDGLVAQLARLEPDAHPGDALMLLAEDWESDAEEYTEPLLIVSRNTHLDPDFRKCLMDFPRPFLLARIDKEGLVELLQCTRSGDELFHKQRMVLPLKKLISAKGPAGELPMLLRQSPCPLRFSTDLSIRWAALGSGPVLWTMTHNRRLMCFDSAGVGAIEIASLPGEILACAATTNIMLVVAEAIANTPMKRHSLVRASRHGDLNVCALDPIMSDQDVKFEFDEHLLRIGRQLTIFDLQNGKVLAKEPLGDRRHIGGRFFNSSNAVWAAVYANGKIQWHKVGETKFEPIYAVIGPQGRLMTYSNNFYFVQVFDGIDNESTRTNETSVDTNLQPRLILKHPDDLTVIVEVAGANNLPNTGASVARQHEARLWLKLDHQKVHKLETHYATAIRELDIRASKYATTQSVRNRMQGIAIVDGSVVLFRNASLGFAFDIAPGPRRIVLRRFKSTSGYSIVNFDREFKPENSPFGHQWTLKKAALPQGEAWLDSRGLLHLRAHDGSELSLVLHDNHVSGWHSDGSVFGTKYFINQPETPVPASVETWLKEFTNS